MRRSTGSPWMPTPRNTPEYRLSLPSGRSPAHLIRLYLMLERDLRPEKANSAMQWATRRKQNFTWLESPASTGDLTVLYVCEARCPDEHCRRVREWARSVWEAWSDHHEVVRRWAGL